MYEQLEQFLSNLGVLSTKVPYVLPSFLCTSPVRSCPRRFVASLKPRLSRHFSQRLNQHRPWLMSGQAFRTFLHSAQVFLAALLPSQTKQKMIFCWKRANLDVLTKITNWWFAAGTRGLVITGNRVTARICSLPTRNMKWFSWIQFIYDPARATCSKSQIFDLFCKLQLLFVVYLGCFSNIQFLWKWKVSALETLFFINEKSTKYLFLENSGQRNFGKTKRKYLELVESHGQGKQRIENLVTWLHPNCQEVGRFARNGKK